MERTEIIRRLKTKLEKKEPIIGVGASTNELALCCEKEKVDLLFVYNFSYFKRTANNVLFGFLPYGDSNEIVQNMGERMFFNIKDIPVVAGICCNDPFRIPELFIRQLTGKCYSAVQNFPSAGLIDGLFRQNLEETTMGYTTEINAVRIAHELDIFTVACVFDTEQARKMVKAGADVLAIHTGLLNVQKKASNDPSVREEFISRVEKIYKTAKEAAPGTVVVLQTDANIDNELLCELLMKMQFLDGLIDMNIVDALESEKAICEQLAMYHSVWKK